MTKRRRWQTGALVGAAMITAAPAAGADKPATPEAELKALESALERHQAADAALARDAGLLQAELDELRAGLVALAATIQSHESALRDAEKDQAVTARARAEARAHWERDRAQAGRVWAALARLNRSKPDSLGLLPGDLVTVRRSALLLTAAGRALAAQAAAHAATLDRLKTAQQRDRQARHKVAQVTEELAAERARLEALIMRKSSLYAVLHGNRRVLAEKVAATARAADDLRALIDQLAVAPPQALEPPAPRARSAAAPTTPPVAESSLPYPAHGTVAAPFGSDWEGRESAGIWMKTLDQGQVVAPLDGVIVFAGPFRSYGRLLILEHAGGYHSLLAGLARIDGVVGQTVRRGEPVGVMGFGGETSPELYVEIRKNGRPVDPVSWLTTVSGKVSG